MASERECLVCGRSFKYCPHCNGNKDIWKSTYCSIECRQIFNTCSSFEGNLISQKDAYDILSKSNITIDAIKPSVKASVEKIMSYKPRETKKEIKVETEEIKVESIEEQPRRMPRRRRPKKVEE